MNKLTRISATVASSLALVAGFAGAAGASPSIDTTGPGSENRISQRDYTRTRVTNNNHVDLTNNNPQEAESGEAEAERNTTVDGVWSGHASNNSTMNATVRVDNSGSSSDARSAGGRGGADVSDASISTTGPGSENVISARNTVKTTVSNNNWVTVTNNNEQTAESGEASAEHNTTVGDVSSGDATNTSHATFDVTVSN